jgi:3-oxoacyl-[acyl-carrier protein] reductase
MFAPAVRRLRSAADVARRFNEGDSAFGRLDVLVNNAGVFRFGDFAEKSFHLHYNINVLGLILTMQDAIKRFGSEGRQYQFQLDRRLASGAGSLLYASTNGAVENLTKGLALELTPRKIRVNAIVPRSYRDRREWRRRSTPAQY